METVQTHYPRYDVMALQDEWDTHTREVVQKRLGTFPQAKFLSESEREMLALIAGHLAYDNRNQILEWVLFHIDQRLSDEIGESQRRPEIPPEKILVREGLKFIDKTARQRHKKNFAQAGTQEQFQILAGLQTGRLTGEAGWPQIQQKELFKKLAELVIGAYYSHPVVWSEIGYGGPAYPRGYVRIEFGLADPWEAQKGDAAPYGFGEEGTGIGK